MAKSLTLCALIFFTFILIACQAIQANSYPGINPSLSPSITPNIPANTLSQLPSNTVITNSTIVSTVTQSRPSATPPATSSPTATYKPLVMCSPLKDETLSSLWEIVSNVYDAPPPGKDDHHHGVDFAYYRRGDRLSMVGEIVQSLLPGNVAASIQDRLPYGNMVIIETGLDMIPTAIVNEFDIEKGESLYSLYAHMENPPEVRLGDEVACGQSLGTVGKTGYDIVNEHLHLETRIGPSGVIFDGMAYYDTSATVSEMDNYLRWRTSGEFLPMDPMLVITAYQSGTIPVSKTPSPFTP